MSDFIKQHTTSQNNINGEDSWVILSPIENSIKQKIITKGVPLKEWEISIYRGLLTGYNEAFVIDKYTRDKIVEKCPKSDLIIRPILRGRDIQKYCSIWNDTYLINTHNGYIDFNGNYIKPIDINDYSQIKQHLDLYSDKITSRQDKGITPYNLRSCIYMDDFSKQKIIYPNMTKFLPFYFDEEGYYTNQKCFIITGENIAYLTAFLNSSVFKYCFKDNFPELQGGTRELSKIFFEKIPVLKVSNETNIDFEKRIRNIQALKKQNQQTQEFEKEIDEMIFDLYSLTVEERNTIGFIEIT